MNTGPGGFGHAPVSKGLVLASFGSSVIANAARASHRRLPRPLLWMSRSLALRFPGELLFGCLLLYYFRVLERQQGSGKYGSYAAVVTGMSYALQLGIGRLVDSSAPLPPAPLPLVFASVLPFLLDIPPASHFTVMGYKMSDKAFVYLAGLQLLLVSGRQSLLTLAASTLAGLLYRLNFCNIKKLRIPGPITRVISRLLSPLLVDPRSDGPSIIMVTNAAAGAAGRQQQGGGESLREGFYQGLDAAAGGRGPAGLPSVQHGATAAAAQAAPTDEALQSLLAMGFSRDRATTALQQAGNDLQTAIALLVG